MWFYLIVFIGAIIFSKKIRDKTIKLIVMIALGILGIIAVIYSISLIFDNLLIVIPTAVIIFLILMFISNINDKKQRENHKIMFETWSSQQAKTFSESDVENMLSPLEDKLHNNDENTYAKFHSDELPYGRLNAFLNYFDTDIYNTDALYYSVVISKDQQELREYGAALTLGGLYIAFQDNNKDSNGNYISKTFNLSFNGMIESEIIDNRLYIKYPDFDDCITIKQSNTTIPISIINELCQFVINSGLSLSIFKEKITVDFDPYDVNEYEFETYDNPSNSEINNRIEDSEAAFNSKNKAMNTFMENTGTAAALPGIIKEAGNVGYNMGGTQPHGVGAEYANNTIDKIIGKRVEHVGGNNQKDGADRYVNGVPIQCKYCESATKTVNSALNGHDYTINGKMMKIEVPRDQYGDSLKIMEEKIRSGKVRGFNPDSMTEKDIKEAAKSTIKKGHVTYDQAKSIATAGSVEGLAIDALDGAITSLYPAGITVLITFANCIWNGVDVNEAIKISLFTGIKVIGKSAIVYTTIMQLSKSKVVDITKISIRNGTLKFGTTNNPAYKLGENLAKKINTSYIAKSTIGKQLGLKNLSGQKIVGGTVVAAITFGPDIARALVGRISMKQLLKNSTVSTSSIAGAKIGQIIIPIPVVGAVVGGAVAGFVCKKVMDKYIEDDSVKMFQILKEEFIDIVMLLGLSTNEFNKVIELSLLHPKLSNILRDMYAFGNFREYARQYIVSPVVETVLSDRMKITTSYYENSISRFVTEQNLEETV